MHDFAIHAVTVFTGFFAIMNPLANTPIFFAITEEDDPATRRMVARRALELAFVLVVIVSVAGNRIFELFGVGLPALRIVGGMLVVKIGFDMIHGEGSRVHTPSNREVAGTKEAALNVAISPLAIPILAGPGTLTTAMNFASGTGLAGTAVTVAAFAVLCGITYLCFVRGERLVKFLGDAGMAVVTRLMGLILAAIGVEMALDGIQGAFHLGSG